MLQRIFSTHSVFFLPLNYFQWIFFKTELSILAISQKLNINLPHTEKFLVLDIYLWYVKAYVHTKTCLQGFLTALLIMAENLETTQMFSWWINKNLEDIRNVPVKFIDGKESAYSVGDGLDPWVGKIPWRRECYPLQDHGLESSMDRGAWWAAVRGAAELDTTKWLSLWLFRDVQPYTFTSHWLTAHLTQNSSWDVVV